MNITNWEICFFISCFLFLCGIAACVAIRCSEHRRIGVITPFYAFLGGVFLSGTALLWPVFDNVFENGAGYVKTFMMSVYYTVRLFLIDGELEFITESISADSGWIYTAYTVFASILFMLAPLMTFGFVMSFFKNISAYRKFVFGRFRDAYVFSELNEKSLTLAEDIHNIDKKRMIVFTGVFENNDEEESYEMTARARKIGAVCFKKDILTLNMKLHSSSKKLCMFTINEDEKENIVTGIKLIEKYREVENTNLFIFSVGTVSEVLTASLDKGKMRVRRVDEIRSLVNHLLYDKGNEVFESAVPCEDGVKEIHAVIVGLGRQGTHFLKSLAWYCQMDGYSITIDAFDSDPLAYEKLYAECPELMSDKYNGVYVNGEAQYKINVHSGIDCRTKTFHEKISAFTKASYVVVALGDDEENIKTAVDLRMLFERNGAKPLIKAVIYDSYECGALDGITDFKGKPYNIDFIGDFDSRYTEEAIIDSEMERAALASHLKWGKEDEFWSYEYNYRSSIASAIHAKARVMCGIPGAGKPEEELTEQESAVIEPLEHRRWNTYMRSEGYIYSGSTDKASRNDLGKLHHDLVDFDALPEDEKRKDRRTFVS